MYGHMMLKGIVPTPKCDTNNHVICSMDGISYSCQYHVTNPWKHKYGTGPKDLPLTISGVL